MYIRKLSNFKQYALNKLSLFKELPEKWKGGRIERWHEFWAHLIKDYTEVTSGVVKGAHSRPLKAIFVTSGLGTAFTALRTNPDEQSFYDNLIQCVTNFTMISELVRNPVTEQHLQYLVRCQNQGLLRKTDLMFFTLMWTADYSSDCDIYAAHCKYLKPKYFTFYERIIDVGLFGTWWNLKQKMKNYDVNPREWGEMT